jgi:hypothetical protein
MMYALPILIAAMFAYMFWHASFSMRRDRILNQKLHRRPAFSAVRARNRPRR